MSDIAPYSEAIVTLGKVFLKAIPPDEIRIARAKERSPLIASIIEWRIKRNRIKQIDRLAKEVAKSGYEPLEFIKYVNNHTEATPMDSLASFLIKQRIERRKNK